MLISALTFKDEDHKTSYFQKMGQFCLDEARRVEASMLPYFTEMDIHAAEVKGDYSHRLRGGQNGDTQESAGGAIIWEVFKRSNLSLNTTRGQVRYLVSKTYDEIFGTRPWFSTVPNVNHKGAKKDDAVEDIAIELQRYVTHKFSQSRARIEHSCRGAIDAAWGINYGILKNAHKRIAHDYQTTAELLVTEKGGDVVLDKTGNPIPKSAEPIEAEGGVKFSGDPSEKIYKDPVFETRTVPKTTLVYSGPALEAVRYRDFLADPTRPTLDECDFIAHKQSFRVGELKATYQTGIVDPDRLEALHKAMDGAEETDDLDYNRVTGILQGGYEAAKGWGMMPNQRQVDTIECYFDYEAPESMTAEATTEQPSKSGASVRMYALVCKNTGEVIWADYLGNVMEKCLVPFTCIRAEDREDTWMGRGFMDRYGEGNTFIDCVYNQIIARNELSANPIVAMDETSVDGGESGESLKWGPGERWMTRGGATLEEAFEVVTIPQLEEITQYLLETTMQTMTQDSGVSGVAQGDVSALPQLNTATGVKQVLSHGSMLNKLSIRNVQSGIEEALGKQLRLMLSMVTGPEEYRYTETKNTKGDNDGTTEEKVGVFDPAKIAEGDPEIRLSLSRFHQDEEASRLARAQVILNEFSVIAPALMPAFAPLVISQLKLIGEESAEEIVAGIIEAAQLMPPEQGPLGGPAPAPKQDLDKLAPSSTPKDPNDEARKQAKEQEATAA